VTQHRCTEELRQLREDASHETTSRTKHWGSPSKNQALGELTPESKLDSADPRSPQKFAAGAGPPDSRFLLNMDKIVPKGRPRRPRVAADDPPPSPSTPTTSGPEATPTAAPTAAPTAEPTADACGTLVKLQLEFKIPAFAF